MNKLRTFVIQYANEIDTMAIPFFRGAAIASLDKKNVLFHNHNGDKLRYAYPLIQYKRIHGKAAVIGIGQGVDVVTQLFSIQDFNYQIGHQNVEMKIDTVNTYDNEISLTDSATRQYRLRNWLPLNSENYAKYQNTESMIERIAILERVLKGNILSFLKGIDIHLEEQIELHITDITSQHPLIYKKVRLMAFDIEFKANITLPQYIGIGKSASVGFGVLTKKTIKIY